MGGEKPFISVPISRYAALRAQDDFDQKPVRAVNLQTSINKPLPRPSGHLSDFYTHPDSYLILPTRDMIGNGVFQEVKTKITTVKWVEFSLRSLEMLGAIGFLFCAIVIQNLATYEIWLLRAVPAVDILVNTYVLFWLGKGVDKRLPKSLASFHATFLCVDAALIACYIYVAVRTDSNFLAALRSSSTWTTMFNSLAASNAITLSTWLIAVTTGLLHALTFISSIYLTIQFSRIAKLPPRSDSPDAMARYSGATYTNNHDTYSKELSIETNQSVNSYLEEIPRLPVLAFQRGDEKTSTNRSDYKPAYSSIPTFEPTKLKKFDMYSPSIYQEPTFARGSTHLELAKPVEGQNQRIISSSSVYSSRLPTMTSIRSYLSTPPLPRKSSKRETTLSENWYVLAAARDDDYSAISTVEEEPEEQVLGASPEKSAYSASRFSFTPSDIESPSRSRTTTFTNGFARQPLRMNPPTPPEGSINEAETKMDKPLPALPEDCSAETPHSPSKYGTPTKKRYGDLQSAFEGVRNSRSPKKNTPTDHDGRVISSSGADIGDASLSCLEKVEDVRLYSGKAANAEQAWLAGSRMNYGGLRGRNVSGKMAEEGMSGGWI